MKKYFKRAVKEDCKLLFEWANDELVRSNSFNSEHIDFEEHKVWFSNKLNSDETCMFIFYIDDNPVGQVRIDKENENGVISYSLDKSFRGMGLALEMLNLLEEQIISEGIKVKVLTGYVKADNIPSQKIFEKLKYTKTLEKNNYKYCKII